MCHLLEKRLALPIWFLHMTICYTYSIADPYDPQECLKASQEPREYQGFLNVAHDGTACEPWVDHEQFYRTHWNQDEAVRHKNYCRNPDNDLKGPWCVVRTDSYKYCNVPKCAADVGCYDDSGTKYFGHEDRTIDGRPCLEWATVRYTNKPEPKYRYRMYLNETYSIYLWHEDDRLQQFRSCRNPLPSKKKPWCFTKQHGSAVEIMEDCDVPKCSDPGSLGYVLNFPNTTHCAEGFVNQAGIVTYEVNGKAEHRTTTYCVAPHMLVNPFKREKLYGSFTDFCLSVVTKTRYCPRGFRRTTRMDANMMGIKPISGPNLFRIKDDFILESFICCSQPEYFRRSGKSIPQHVQLERIPVHKYSSKTDDYWPISDSRTSKLSMRNEDMVQSILEYNDREKPLLVSMLRCPSVVNTTRVFSVDILTYRLYMILDKMIMCEYYSAMIETSQERSTKSSRIQFGLLSNDARCPDGFNYHSQPNLHMITGATNKLCTPKNPALLPTPSTGIGYCLIILTDFDEIPDELNRFHFQGNRWGKPMEFSCPSGFRPNQLGVSKLTPVPVRLCCTGDPSSTAIEGESQKLRVPFEITNSFAVIRNGNRCPNFYSDTTQWGIIEYTQMLVLNDKMELSGQDEPITTNHTFGMVICQYSSPDVKFGVRSLNYRCEGLGDRTIVFHNGATCAIALNETDILPQGKYCLYKVGYSCPSGFVSNEAHLRPFRSSQGYCCRTEESIGSINLPVKLYAPFKLPAIHQPCQAISGYMVDMEFGQCVYYPQNAKKMALMIWPRIVNGTAGGQNKSEPLFCEISKRKYRRPPVRNRAGFGRNFLFVASMHDRWLTYKRPRWTSQSNHNEEACFTEASWDLLPQMDKNGKTYCIFVFGSCPVESFETLGSSPFMNTVLCCSLGKPRHDDETKKSSTTYNSLRSLTTLGYALPNEKQHWRNFRTSTILSTESVRNNESEGCPQFPNLQLDRRILDILKAPTDLPSQMTSPKLFNVSRMDKPTFEEHTGIWMDERSVYVIYCEYRAMKPEKRDNKTWPTGMYAIPKAVTNCPNESRLAGAIHIQNENGVYYSKPIHLDGSYLPGLSYAALQFCVFGDPMQQQSSQDSDLPLGHYCVLRVREKCPEGFIEGHLTLVEGSKSDHIKGALYEHEEFGMTGELRPDITREKLLTTAANYTVSRMTYSFCCRTDSSSASHPIDGFPSETGPFYLYRVGDQCQEIQNMRVTPEFICMDAPNDIRWYKLEEKKSWTPYRTEGLTPVEIPYHKQCDAQINLCYYEKDISHIETIAVSGSGQWPSGKYALPNVHRADDDELACPPGFKQRIRSLLENRDSFFSLDVIPHTLENYFVELLGHGNSAMNIHYCERVENGTLDGDAISGSISKEEAVVEWPRGDYCVFSADPEHHCPPGLHRYSRAVEELCCRTDELLHPPPVKWPFIGDFFLISQNHCLPIENTKVEQYLVRLDYRRTPDSIAISLWDRLCHYLPEVWFQTKPSWPSGEYMLPIGRKGGLHTSSIIPFIFKGEFRQEYLPDSMSDLSSSQEQSSSIAYECPEHFQRTRFTFMSQEMEQRLSSEGVDNEKNEYKFVSITAMEFCVKTNQTNSTSQWPRGDYCVFTINTACPDGMSAGDETVFKIPGYLLKSSDFVDKYGNLIKNRHWHDENENKIVYFMRCCRTDHHLTLNLPVSKDGYYLGSLAGRCSHIPGTLLDKSLITTYFRTPETINTTNWSLDIIRDIYGAYKLILHDIASLELCYYHPGSYADVRNALGGLGTEMAMNLTENDLDDLARKCGCAENARCLIHRVTECTCKVGYFGDGRHVCHQITPFTDKCANLCDPNADCVSALPTKHKPESQHTCLCKTGFLGDGFTCKPSCLTLHCHAFSQCVINPIRGEPECKCLPGSIASNGKCHTDVYKSIQLEKDLPQFLVYHDHCLSKKLQQSLKYLEPERYFYLFASSKLIKSCDEVTSHTVALPEALYENELESTDENNPIQMITENQTVIEIYLKNNTWFIDGTMVKEDPYRFTNGMMYVLSAPLKLTPYIDNRWRHRSFIALGVIVLLLIFSGLIIYIELVRRKKVRSPRLLIPRRPFRHPMVLFRHPTVPFRRAMWSSREETVLVEDTSDAEE